MFNRSAAAAAAAAAEAEAATPIADENNIENPLLQTANDGLETPMPLSHAAAVVDLEDPLPQTSNDGGVETPTPSSSRRRSGGCPAGCEWPILALVFLALFGIVIHYFAEEVNLVDDDPGFRLDSVVVSSFDVSKTFPETRWDTKLSLGLTEGDFKKLDVRYEAPRLWLYSGDEGFVSMTSPSMEYSLDGKKLILHAVFGMEEDIKHQVVNLDLVMESNAVHITKIHASEVEIKSFMMINCYDLKIEFDRLNKRFGKLIDGGKSCRVQVCPIEAHPLYDGPDECSSSTTS